jgi:hypothetical protein
MEWWATSLQEDDLTEARWMYADMQRQYHRPRNQGLHRLYSPMSKAGRCDTEHCRRLRLLVQKRRSSKLYAPELTARGIPKFRELLFSHSTAKGSGM